MRINQRLTKLEQSANTPEKVDFVAVMTAARDAAMLAHKTGQSRPDSKPIPPEWEHSRSPLARAIFAARRRCGP